MRPYMPAGCGILFLAILAGALWFRPPGWLASVIVFSAGLGAVAMVGAIERFKGPLPRGPCPDCQGRGWTIWDGNPFLHVQCPRCGGLGTVKR